MSRYGDGTYLEADKYLALHSAPIIPTSIVIDPDEFDSVMLEYQYAFRSWGEKKKHFPRYGLPLVNDNGSMYNNPEPVCYPLDEWLEHLSEEDWVFDRDFTTKTTVFEHLVFDPLRVFDGYWARSCILRWDSESFFYPHSDTWLPSPILRLWGTTDPEHARFQFDREYRRPDTPGLVPGMNPDMIDWPGEIEAGRMYLVDTSLIHTARSIGDHPTHQFFLAVHTDAYDIMESVLDTTSSM